MSNLFSLSNPVYRHTIENSGYSVNLDNSIPVTGYMVSLKGYEKQINILTFSPADVDQFIRANLAILHNRKCYIGTWIENDTVFIDISMNLQNKRASLAFASDNGQIAIFDVINNKTIYTLQTV